MPAESTYRFGDLTVSTNLPVASLPRSHAPRPAWRVRFHEGATVCREDVPYHTWHDDTGRAIATFARGDTRRIISFRGVARFDLDPESGVIACTASRRTSRSAVAQLLVHQVLPLAAGMERLALHASAVVFDGDAIAFTGRSGAGKSTLAARLAHRGYELITDDVAIIEDWQARSCVVPMGAPIRLWPDAVRALIGRGAIRPLERVRPSSRKRLLSLTDPRIRHALAATPLGAVFVLDDACPTGKSIVVMDPRDAVAEVMRHSFILATDDPMHAARVFERASHLVAHARVYRLPTPTSFDDLDAVLDSVLAALRTKN